MAHRTPFLLLNIFKLYVQYLCASLAGIPAGLLAYVLVRAGISEVVAFSVAIVIGIIIAIPLWRLAGGRTLVERIPSPATAPAVTSNALAFPNSGGVVFAAGTLMLIAASAHNLPRVEYRLAVVACRTGTLFDLQGPSPRE